MGERQSFGGAIGFIKCEKKNGNAIEKENEALCNHSRYVARMRLLFQHSPFLFPIATQWCIHPEHKSVVVFFSLFSCVLFSLVCASYASTFFLQH